MRADFDRRNNELKRRELFLCPLSHRIKRVGRRLNHTYLKEEELEQVIKILTELPDINTELGCDAMKHSLYVDSYGNLYPCIAIRIRKSLKFQH